MLSDVSSVCYIYHRVLEQRILDLRRDKHGIVGSQNSRSCRVEQRSNRGVAGGRVDDFVVGGSGGAGFRETSVVLLLHHLEDLEFLRTVLELSSLVAGRNGLKVKSLKGVGVASVDWVHVGCRK